MDDGTQKKVFEFQILQAHLQELQRRQEMVAERLTELGRSAAALEELATVKPGSSALIPMGGDNFASGKITDTKSILVGVGGGIAIKKSVGDAKGILEGRIKELEGMADKLGAEMQSTIAALARLQPELEAIAGARAEKR